MLATLHSTPLLGGTHWNIAIPFGTEKLERYGYPLVKKNLRIYLTNNVETSYFTQLKICYLMTTFRCPSDILITS